MSLVGNCYNSLNRSPEAEETAETGKWSADERTDLKCVCLCCRGRAAACVSSTDIAAVHAYLLKAKEKGF